MAADTTSAPLRTDIVSDVVCPWCAVGYNQLAEAARRTGVALDIHWQPFELNPDMAPEGEDLREHLADFDRFAVRFSESFAKRIDLGEILEVVYVPLYDRYFEESELEEIVTFYRSQAGRKTLAVMPVIMREGLAATAPLLEPRVMALVGEILAEERDRVVR